MPFVELSALTNFTFLTGASHPEEMILRASEMGSAGSNSPISSPGAKGWRCWSCPPTSA